MTRGFWARRPNLAHAARVAVVATLVIAVVYVAVAAALDAFLGRRVLWEVDQRLSLHLSDVSRQANPLATRTVAEDQGTDGAPVFVWWVSPAGRVRSLTVGNPRLADRVLAGVAATGGGPVSVSDRHDTYRVEATSFRDGWLMAGQNLAGPSHIEKVMLTGELVIGPALLLAVFVGVLVIGLRAVAPVEQARRRLLEFTADASHELRTPLTVIEAEIELARATPPDAAADRETLEHVARESRRLKTIVEDLLWLARFDSAPPPPPNEPVDLVTSVDTCADRFTAVAGARELTLTVVHLGDGPAWIEAAPDWLERLVGTLLDNACRYAPAGGTVQVSVGAQGTRAVLVVEDSGPGIPPDQRDRLFDRFRRATDHPGGAGLGLAIADSVVRTTAGRWRVADSALGGALMEVSWRRGTGPPKAPGGTPTTGRQAGPPASPPGSTGRPTGPAPTAKPSTAKPSTVKQ
ncbi:MAG TPA: HAMP domain-containing sensor histidine kinase [Acidimicrobiales bacterium]|nr:HAMP domain-containing sensor histidine kinase [Acidimicrobiales bacterium]